MDVKYSTDAKIENNARMYKLQKAQFEAEIGTAVSIFLFGNLKNFFLFLQPLS